MNKLNTIFGILGIVLAAIGFFTKDWWIFAEGCFLSISAQLFIIINRLK